MKVRERRRDSIGRMKQTARARLLAAFLPALCILGYALPASADLPPVLANAASTSAKAGSYHVALTETIGSTTVRSVGDVQSLAPAKMHMTTIVGGPSGTVETIVVAPDSYVKTGGAAWKKSSGDAADYAQMNVASMLAKANGDYAITDLGMQLKDGRMLHGYKVVNTTRNSMQTVYLDSAGRFARLEMRSVVMQFSNYGEPLDIKPPM